MSRKPGAGHPEGGVRDVFVWDVPVRLFHWTMVVLIAVSWITAELGSMTWHMRSGYAILALVVFRLLWGFFGSRHARFASFVRGPAAVLAYARSIRSGAAVVHPGHNPLGGWSVLALLIVVLVQACTGLFANDDIATEGPMVRYVSAATSSLLTSVHHINFNVLLGLVGLHVAAVLFYLLVKRDNLIVPMFTGRKRLPAGVEGEAGIRPFWIAALLFAACAGAVAALVTVA